MSDSGEEQSIRVPDELLDYDENLVYTLHGRRFTGIGYADVPGHGLSEIEYRDGSQEGTARDWYPSGQLQSVANYRKNALHGLSQEYRPDGSLISEETYDRGVLIRSVKWDAVGNVSETFTISPDSPESALLKRLDEQGL